MSAEGRISYVSLTWLTAVWCTVLPVIAWYAPSLSPTCIAVLAFCWVCHRVESRARAKAFAEALLGDESFDWFFEQSEIPSHAHSMVQQMKKIQDDVNKATGLTLSMLGKNK